MLIHPLAVAVKNKHGYLSQFLIAKNVLAQSCEDFTAETISSLFLKLANNESIMLLKTPGL